MSLKKSSLLLRQFILVLTLIAANFGGISIQPAQASTPLAMDFATQLVTNTNDTGPGSLRQAILDAADGDIITFDSSLAGQIITLSSTIPIDKNLNLDGSGLSANIQVSGNNAVGIFNVADGVVANMDHIDIINGNNINGGGIYNSGTLSISNCTFTNNQAVNYGSAIYTEALPGSGFVGLTVTSCVFSNNNGFVVASYFADALDISSSTFSNNTGWAILNLDGTMSVSQSTFANNQGGIENLGTGSIDNCTFSNNNEANNVSGGSVVNTGMLTVTNSTFTNNIAPYYGGGIYNSSGSLIVSNSTFSGNQAGEGGGIYNVGNQIDGSASLTVTNSSFLSNDGGFAGGGINNHEYATLTVLNSTFYGNSAYTGGGIQGWNGQVATITNSTFSHNSSSNEVTTATIHWAGSLNLKNTIIANSVSGYDCIAFETATDIHNLIENNGPGLDGCGTPVVTDDPLLGPPADNGGPTQTLALLPGSPAIGAGDNATCAATDQRGVARPQGAACDIGAYEYDGDAILPSVISVTRVSTSPTSAASVDYTVTFSEPVSGVDATDFALTKTGSITGYAVTNVSPASGPADTYTVGVGTGKYNGTLRLDVLNDGSIQDEAGNSLASGYTGGEAYTITKNYKTTLKSTGSQDGWVLESGERTNTGGTLNATATTLRLGDNAQKKQYRSILSFSTKGLPDNAVITKVTLKVRKQGILGGGNPLNLFQGFMVDIKKGLFGTSALQAGDFQAQASKSYGPFKPALINGWYTINLTSAKTYINKLATGGGLTQVRLRFKLDDNNDNLANYLSLYSGNAAAASRPQLIIGYYVP